MLHDGGFYSVLISAGIFCMCVEAAEIRCLSASVPVHKLRSDAPIIEWLLLGPFPNPELVDPESGLVRRTGHTTDYLTSLGGEADAAPRDDTAVAFRDAAGTERCAAAQRVAANHINIVNIKSVYGTEKQVAYAFCYILVDQPQQVSCYIGSDDGAKIWVNGALKLDVWQPEGRSCRRGDNTFSFQAKQGLNSLLVKVEDRGGKWEFTVEACDEKGEAARKARAARKQAVRALQNAELGPHAGGFVIHRGPLPEIGWQTPEAVAPVLGNAPLTVSWYRETRGAPKAAFREVTSARRPGRYAAIVETESADGLRVRRKLSFLCVPKDWRPPIEKLHAYAEAMPLHPVFEYDLPARVEAIAQYHEVPPEGFGSELDAIFLGVVDQVDTCAWPLDVSDRWGVAYGDAQLALRLKLEGKQAKQKLKMPRKKRGAPSPVLRQGTPETAGLVSDTPERLRALCEEWHEVGQEPFAVLIARHGVIAFQEAYGDTTLDTPMWVASISKLVTGVMFAQFIDQGILGIDEPVGHYLPDFPVEGPKRITLRQCFTHTTGFEGHNEWGGIYNQYIDNVLANGLEAIAPGEEFLYNGMGHNLAGKVMEIAGGKSILRTMYENFLMPLGMGNTTVGHLGSGACSTPGDMARLGQMLLNRGSYGERVFFSPETFQRMLPTDLSAYWPRARVEVGMGIGWMREPAGTTKLSANVIGHGAASGAILRVDLDNDLVIVQTRNEPGPRYEEYAHRFFKTVGDCLVE